VHSFTQKGAGMRLDGRDTDSAASRHTRFANERTNRRDCFSGGSLVIEPCADARRVRWTARFSTARERAVDAREVGLGHEQCLFALEESGELLGVASGAVSTRACNSWAACLQALIAD
jgi:hypothetical protein